MVVRCVIRHHVRHHSPGEIAHNHRGLFVVRTLGMGRSYVVIAGFLIMLI
jgi:hypothetical protein